MSKQAAKIKRKKTKMRKRLRALIHNLGIGDEVLDLVALDPEEKKLFVDYDPLQIYSPWSDAWFVDDLKTFRTKPPDYDIQIWYAGPIRQNGESDQALRTRIKQAEKSLLTRQQQSVKSKMKGR